MNNAKPLTHEEIEELRVKYADGALQASPFMQRVVATWDAMIGATGPLTSLEAQSGVAEFLIDVLQFYGDKRNYCDPNKPGAVSRLFVMHDKGAQAREVLTALGAIGGFDINK